MMPIAHYLFSISYSGYFNKNNWQNWADQRILRQETVEDWLINVSLASNIEKLSDALSGLLISERHNICNLSPASDAIIGYYYLKYLEGKLSLYELLMQSGDEADGGEGATVECEEFYAISNEVEKDARLVDDTIFQEKIATLFKPFRVIAEQQKEALVNY